MGLPCCFASLNVPDLHLAEAAEGSWLEAVEVVFIGGMRFASGGEVNSSLGLKIRLGYSTLASG